MSNFLSKALMAIALDKKARDALKQSRQAKADAAKAAKKPRAKADAPASKARPQPKAAAKPAPTPPDTAPLSVTETLEQADKSERRELIRNAIKLRREKMSVLVDLSEEQRHALQIAALQAIIERGKAGGGGGS